MVKPRSDQKEANNSAVRGTKSSNGRRPPAFLRTPLLQEGTPEFDARCRDAMDKVCQKYAWTAKQGGIILRSNPLKLPPLQDYVYTRIAKAEYGFRYQDAGGRKKLWYPVLEKVFSQYLEPEYHEDAYDGSFVIAERIEFLPGEPEVTHDADGCRVLNLWKPPPWTAHDHADEPAFFLEHLRYIFDNDETAIEHVLNFLAHIVQRPQERIAHALLITSEAKGIGKSTLGTIVRRLVGEQNSRVAQKKDLKSSFDGWLVGKLVVHVDEIYEAGSAPLNIEDGDRRYFVFNSKAQPRSDEYYEELYRSIETPSEMNAIYSFLKRRDLSGFNPHRRPPMTEAKRQIIAESEHPLHTYIVEAVISGHFRRLLGDEFSFDELQRQLTKDGYGMRRRSALP
jgi:hypothetical protein